MQQRTIQNMLTSYCSKQPLHLVPDTHIQSCIKLIRLVYRFYDPWSTQLLLDPVKMRKHFSPPDLHVAREKHDEHMRLLENESV